DLSPSAGAQAGTRLGAAQAADSPGGLMIEASVCLVQAACQTGFGLHFCRLSEFRRPGAALSTSGCCPAQALALGSVVRLCPGDWKSTRGGCRSPHVLAAPARRCRGTPDTLRG